MILIIKGQSNTITLTLTEKCLLTTNYFLFYFKSEFRKEVSVVLTDTSSYKDRFNRFTFVEPTDGELLEGLWDYQVYEQADIITYADYSAIVNHGGGYGALFNIIINGVDHAISLPFPQQESAPNLQTFLNTLGLGDFTVTDDGTHYIISSLQNTNEIETIQQAAGFSPATDYPFTQTNVVRNTNRAGLNMVEQGVMKVVNENTPAANTTYNGQPTTGIVYE